MTRFENKLIRDIYATRYIASWMKMGGDFSRHRGGRFDFKDWLESLGLDKDEVNHIYNLADNGKLELEYSAKKFIESLRG